MIMYLLIISLILHAATILWIIVLMQKFNQQSPLEVEALNVSKVTREIEDLLVAYTEEMKAENERLKNELLNEERMKRKSEPSINIESELRERRQTEPIETQEVHIIKKSKIPQVEKVIAERDDGQERYSKYEPPIVEENEADVFEQSDTLKVLTLAKQGLTVDEIAKNLHMGKGEVELLLKFYQ